MVSRTEGFEVQPASIWIVTAWLALVVVLGLAAAALILSGPLFDWSRELHEVPSLELTGGMMASGIVFLATLPLIRWTLTARRNAWQQAFVIVILGGLGLRIAMLASTPALEDDFYRYLWDGAATAHGLNPYALSPYDAAGAAIETPWGRLAEENRGTLDRVNHPELKTIYPPVAQAMFALAHWLSPWSLQGWRIVCLIGELATLALILLLLRDTGRPLLWSALYWLNPLVIKELVGSAHMEAIVLPFVLGAIWLAVRQWHVSAAATLGLAIGAKLWPVMLVPLILRPLLAHPARLVAALAILAAMALAWTLPPLLGGLDDQSGFVAYAANWQTNSALFQGLQAVMTWLLSGFGVLHPVPGLIVRGAMAGLVGLVALYLARTPAERPLDTVRHCAIVVCLLFFVSPAQFPWYVTWTAIFLPFFPFAGLLALTLFVPIYYAGFHFLAIDDYAAFNRWVIWCIWPPVWSLLAWDALREWRRPLDVNLR